MTAAYMKRKEEETCVSFNLIMRKGSRNRRLVFVKWAEPYVGATEPCCAAVFQVRFSPLCNGKRMCCVY
jgi:hypothetical protein